jgi:tetratricopeptide (TPR) repeat protein
VVAQAMRTSLGQSDAVRLVSASEIAGVLARMTMPTSTPLTLATARELAAREGIPLIVTGQVAAVGGGFMVTATLLGAESGETLVELQQAADGPGELLGAIDALALDLRERIGESLRSVARAPRLEEATTGSLEALREYTRGVEAGDLNGDWTRGLVHLRAAVTEDSTFASAWRKIAVYASNQGAAESEQFAAASAAYRFRDRAIGSERAQIEAYYLQGVSTKRALEIYWRERGIPRNNLALLLNGLARFSEAESVLVAAQAERERSGGSPRIIQETINLLSSQLSLRKLADARVTIAVLEKDFANTSYTDRAKSWYALAVGGMDSVSVVAARLRESPRPVTRVYGVALERALAGARGEYRRYRALVPGLVAIADSAQAPALAEPMSLAVTDIVALSLGTASEAAGLRALDSLAGLMRDQSLPLLDRHDLLLAWAYARLGRADRARVLLEEADRAATAEERLARWDQAQVVRGEIALLQADADAALAAFRRGVDADSGVLGSPSVGEHFERIARAFELAGRRDSAIVYLERYRSLSDFGFIQRHLALLYPDVLRRLARLYAQHGDPVRARETYDQLLRLWRDADSVLAPVIADIRSRRDEISTR